MNCLAMYKNDRPHNAKPKSGCPATAHNMPQTFNKITGIINNIYILSVNIPDYRGLIPLSNLKSI